MQKSSIVLILFILLGSLLWWKWPHIRAYFAPPPPSYGQSYNSGIGTGMTQSYRKAYFAAGCFWCAESGFEKYPGVIDAISGYAGGTTPNPTYEQVAGGTTDYRESVEVVYDPTIIDYPDLLQIFYRTANPVDDGGQYVDRGRQYTSAIWYQNDEEKKFAEESKTTLEKSMRFGEKKLVTPVLPFTTFYKAEDYHQNYYKVNPIHYTVYTNGSGRKQYQEKIWGNDYSYTISQKQPTSVSSQGAMRRVVPTQEELKIKLTPLQYKVTQNAGTETPFINEYWDNEKEGIYVDIVDGTPLYSSRDKYDSGTGWPSFTKPIENSNISLHSDNTFFASRMEVRGQYSNSHIGHVFDDGPVDKGGKRYCMNSAALRFVPLENMEREGYGDFISIVKK